MGDLERTNDGGNGLSDRRCDGCGSTAPGMTFHEGDDGDLVAKYCPGCEDTRIVEGVDPGDHGDHEQYRLREL